MSNLYSAAYSAASSKGDYEASKIKITDSLSTISYEDKVLNQKLDEIKNKTEAASQVLELGSTIATGMEETASFKENLPYAEKQLQEIHGNPDLKLEEVGRTKIKKALDYLTGTPTEYTFGDTTFSGKDDFAELKALGKYGKIYDSPYKPGKFDNKQTDQTILENNSTEDLKPFESDDIKIIAKSDITTTDEYGFATKTDKNNKSDNVIKPKVTVPSIDQNVPLDKEKILEAKPLKIEKVDEIDWESFEKSMWEEVQETNPFDTSNFDTSKPNDAPKDIPDWMYEPITNDKWLNDPIYIQQYGMGKRG